MTATGKAVANPTEVSLSHSEDTAMSLAVERWLVRARWLIVAVVGLATPLLALGYPQGTWEYLVIAMLLGAGYNLLLQTVIIPRHSAWLTKGYLTTFGDTALTSYAVLVSGGFDSPLYLAYFLLVISAAMRYGSRASLGTAAFITLIYVSVSLYMTSFTDALGQLVLRSGFLWLIAAFAGFLSMQARAARRALRAELRRTKALHQATSAPSASLSLDVVLQSVVEQACVLVGADEGVVTSRDTERVVTSVSTGGGGDQSLVNLLSSNLPLRQGLLDLGRAVLGDNLLGEDGLSESADQIRFGPVIGCLLATHDRVVGELFIVRRRDRQPFDAIDQEAAMAFASRAALAIENAFLYESLKANMEEIKHTQSQLIQSAKLAAIGELAANVAHEINNPLTGILMHAGLLMEAPREGEQGSGEDLAEIYKETLRARGIVRNLLDFARQSQPSVAPTNVNDVLEQTLPLVLHRAAMQNVAVAKDWCDDIPQVAIDPNQFKQVFINLVNNALDAMPDGGQLTISTRAVGREVTVKFTDNGGGIPPENLPRLFEPFFSTKPAVKGTGLGLSVSHGIVSKHGGSIEAHSTLGKGSTFTVRLQEYVAAEKEASLVS